MLMFRTNVEVSSSYCPDKMTVIGSKINEIKYHFRNKSGPLNCLVLTEISWTVLALRSMLHCNIPCNSVLWLPYLNFEFIICFFLSVTF